MSAGSLWLMAAIGLLLLAGGGALLISAARRRRAESRYVSRLAAVMVGAVGLILIVFAGSWTVYD